MDSLRIFEKYNLVDFLKNHLTYGISPSSYIWKTTLRKRLNEHYSSLSCDNMSRDPVLKIYLNYFPKPNTFSQIWCLGKKYPSLSKDCQSSVHILSQLFAHKYLKPCFKCGRIIKSISEHLVFECPHNEISRQKF